MEYTPKKIENKNALINWSIAFALVHAHCDICFAILVPVPDPDPVHKHFFVSKPWAEALHAS